MFDFAFSDLGKRVCSAFQVNNLLWGEIKRFKETMSNIKAVLQDVEQSVISKDLEIWLRQLDGLLKHASYLLYEIEHWRQGSDFQKLCRFFNCPNSLEHSIKKMSEQIDEITAEGVNLVSKPVGRHVGVPATSVLTPAKHSFQFEKLRETVLLIIARIDKLLDEYYSGPILYVVACIFGVFVDPFFLYIPFLSHAKMCLGMNRELWKVAVALKTGADFFAALMLPMSIDRPQLGRFMSSIKSILLMCVKYLALAPIPQFLFSEEFILGTLGGYTFWNLILLCYYGARLVLTYQSCEQRKTMVSSRTLVRFIAPVYLFLFLIVSHLIGASWYYLSIKRLLSCWKYACKNITRCTFPCDGTTPLTLNSTLVIEFCPLNPQKFGIYLDALKSGIVEDKGVGKKFLQCFFWGLRNLSSFGSNLHTSTNDGETFFAIIISAVALILLIYIVASISIQRYSELESARSELESARSELESARSELESARSEVESARSELESAKSESTKSAKLRIVAKFRSSRWERIEHEMERARPERIVDNMEPIKELIECLVVFHNLDDPSKKSILEHIQEAFENGYKSFNLERLRNNHFLNDVTKTKSVLKDLRFLEEWVFNGKPNTLRKARKWLSDNNIPHDRDNILFYLTCRLRDDEDVNLTNVRSVLPDKSKWWMTMKDLCFDTLKKVPGLQNIDEECFKSISSILKPVIYPSGIYIFRRGEPMEVIIFITRGTVSRSRCYASGSVSVEPKCLKKGDFVGAELIKWRLESDFCGVSGSSEPPHVMGDFFFEEYLKLPKTIELELGRIPIPISTADFKSVTQVEAFVLTIEDLAVSSDFLVESRSANSATERVDSSSRTKEDASTQGN